jgi:hypothetical protein
MNINSQFCNYIFNKKQMTEEIKEIHNSLWMKQEYSEDQIIKSKIVKISEDEYSVSIPVSVQKFIKIVLIDELYSVVKTSYFLAFISIGSGIEFLGKCIDDSCPLDWDMTGRSSINFNEAICNITPLKKYENLIDRADGFDLYNRFRCGLIHGMAPKKGLSLSHGNEQKTIFNNPSGLVNINVDELYIDFKLACEDVINRKYEDPNKMNSAKLYVNCLLKRD